MKNLTLIKKGFFAICLCFFVTASMIAQNACPNNLLNNGDFNTSTCGGNAFGAGCVANWAASDGTPTLAGYPLNPYAWMWSYNGNGEAISANFNFVAGTTYNISFRIKTDDKNTGCKIVAQYAKVNLVATNTPGNVTSNPGAVGEIIFQDGFPPYLNTWTTVTVSYLATVNSNFLWIFPFMQQSDNTCQAELSVDDICIEEAVVISEIGAYCCEGENLVTNGNFEYGNTGFLSAYTNSAATYPGEYDVVSSASAFGATVMDHSFCEDPTLYATNNKFMVVNGKTQQSGSSVIWEQTITGLEKGQEYKFCANFKDMEQCTFNIYPRITVNAGLFSTTQVIDTDDSDPCDWERIEICFTANQSTMNLKIELDETGNGDGNDLAIDDIAVQQKVDPNYFITVQHQGNNNAITGSLNTIVNTDDTLLNEACESNGLDDFYWFIYEPLDPTAPLFTSVDWSTFAWGNDGGSYGSVISAPGPAWNLTSTFPDYIVFDNNRFYVIGMYIPSCCESCYTDSWEYQITYNNGFAPSSGEDFSEEMKEEIKKRFVKSRAGNLGNEKEMSNERFSLYPNPAQESFNVILSDDTIKSIEIVSLSGQVVFSTQLKEGRSEETIDVSVLSSGMYFVNVLSNNQTRYKAKLIKE
jgi:hypothetical protein